VRRIIDFVFRIVECVNVQIELDPIFRRCGHALA
jgi:hypothetical protein